MATIGPSYLNKIPTPDIAIPIGAEDKDWSDDNAGLNYYPFLPFAKVNL